MSETQIPTPPRLAVKRQFVKDLSFENIAGQKQLGMQGQPDIQVSVGVGARAGSGEGEHEVSLKMNVTAKVAEETIFILEVDYAGVFTIENVPAEQMAPFVMIECPRMLFPFVRRVVSDVTRDGGFPPLNVETVDFLNLYRQQMARQQAAQQQQADASPAQ